MDVAFYLGTLAIHRYGILIALAVVAALGIAFIEARRRGEAVSTTTPQIAIISVLLLWGLFSA
jgi:prolipoprotein diacylglyceryltransferase